MNYKNYKFYANIYFMHVNSDDDYCLNKRFHHICHAERYVANELYKALEKRLNNDFIALKDSKLYESKYIHDFKIMGHIKNNLTIMDELRELYLKGKSVDYIIDYDIEPMAYV